MIRVNLPDGRAINVRTDNVDLAKSRARKYLEDNPLIERGAQLGEEDIGATGDIGRGIGAGLVSAAEGIATLPSQLAGDQESEEELRRFFDKYRPEVHTDLGEAVKFITQFAAPGGFAARAVRGLGSVAKVSAFAAADVAATTPDVETLGDFFEAGPTQRIDTSDLNGAELAAANLSNRIKVGAEGAAFVLGVPAIATLGLKAVGATAGAIGKTDFVKAAAQAIKDPNTPFHEVGIKPDLENPAFFRRNIDRLKKSYKKYATFQGEMPDRFSKQYDALRISEIAAQSSAARQAVEKIDSAVSFVNKNEGVFNNQDKSRILNTLNDYLFAEESLAKPGLTRKQIQQSAEKELKEIDEIIGKNLSKSLFGKRKDLSLFDGARDLRGQIDGLSDSVKDILRDPILNPEMQKDLIDTIGNNKTYYGMRLYRALNDTNYAPTVEQSDRAVRELVATSSGLPEKYRLNDEQARSILNNMLQNNFTNAKMAPRDIIETPVLSGVAQGMLKGRRLDNLPAVRDFLGEYTGAKDVMMRNKPELIRARDVGEQEIGLRTKMVETVDVMSKQIAKARYYKNLMDYNKALGDKAFIFDEIPPNAQLGEYSRIGVETANPLAEIPESAKRRFGPLAGKYVRNDYKSALENGSDVFNLAEGNMGLYATFLGLKGMSQIAKTVYSPITQIRNATTAGFFALANGNVGNAKSLSNAVSTVFSNLNRRLTGPGKTSATLADRQKYYNELVDLGVINTNAKIGEFESLLNDAIDNNAKGKALFKWAQGKQNGFAAKLYQASDDVWKTYSYEMELGRLQRALAKDPVAGINTSDPRNFVDFGGVIRPSELTEEQLELALKREAAEIVKDTVPNYARVPLFIKQLRQLPFGNFVAFPAEIIRTSGNILGRGIKELASESAEIRAIGMKRILGLASVNVAIPQSLMIAGTQLTGADEEQVQAYKRSMAADWDRNSTLIPIATDKDGNITDLYNFSYTNPYDYLKRPVSAVLNAVQNGITKEEDLTDIAFKATLGGDGAVSEFFSPFMSESIITEKIADLARNKTTFNRPIYREADTLGTKLGKSFAHLADGITPGFLPFDVTTSPSSAFPLSLDLRMRDLPRAVASTVAGDEKLGVSRQGYRLDPAQEFTEALTGVKSLKPRVERVLYYRAQEAGRNVRDAGGIFTSIAKERGNVDAETLTQAFITANEQRFKALRDLNMAVEDAKTLGLSNAEIIKPLRDAKTPYLNFLMADRFKAFFPSKETISIALQGNEDKLANPIDLREIAKNYGQLQGTLFRPQAAAEAEAIREQQQQAPGAVQPLPEIDTPKPTTPPQALVNRGVQALRDLELRKLLGID